LRHEARRLAEQIARLPELVRIGRGSNQGAVTSEARQVSRMAFGPFAVKTSFGETTIVNPTTATAFLRALGPSYRTTYHWKVAERMLDVAWTSAEAEDMAAQAFKIALEADDLLID
jgi:hypothetical protein